MSVPTPHNEAIEGQIAPFVLMPGDPLRAKKLAETYLTDVKRFNAVRNMFGYTGTYQGHVMSVMGSGMGMPSIGIYSYELFNFYGVESIVRIGTAGALSERARLRDLVLAQGACTDSNYANQFNAPGTLAPIADFGLLRGAAEQAERLGYPVQVGNVVSSDAFYNDDETVNGRWARMGALAVEMESAALYLNAMRAGKRALTILTITDQLVTDEHLSSEERQEGLVRMMEVALGLAVSQDA
ncbi:MAG: purine-nucleoside phosphorylase [Tractidigestivibacter sp.]|jgi:purine-nucleoside phosphorylase|uniref:purine-nucleoside phosphorylase n=1 Tax=Tractidigestivibacter sp. TaxID=2847320 RepID=UPI003D8C4DFA